MNKILIIQTAFIGDVILATPVLEKLHLFYPDAKIDFMLRKGNEDLFKDHPIINQLIVWNKHKGKYYNLLKYIFSIRKRKYDAVINLQRFAATGIITAFSGAEHRLGFDKNPFSFMFTERLKHEIGNGLHETARNLRLIKSITDEKYVQPKLYPSTTDFKNIFNFKLHKYICIAPTSVLFTKQLPLEKWLEFIVKIPLDIHIFLLGAQSDKSICDEIKAKSRRKNIEVLCGKLSLLESAALMKDADMNYVNDSAPMHLASAVDAPTTAIYCSTIPAFGFGPLATNSTVIETKEKLDCRPCGITGKKECPLGHFKCANNLDINQIDIPQ